MVEESFFNNSYYRLNKIFLSRLGTWPEQSLFMRCCLPILHLFILTTLMAAMTRRLLDLLRAHDVDTVLDCLTPMLLTLVCYVQLLNGSFNRKTIHRMLKRIASDWQRLGQSPNNIDIIQKLAVRGRLITTIYVTGMYVECSLYLAPPFYPVIMDVISPLNETRPKYYIYEVEYGVNNDDYYWPILVHAYLASWIGVGIVSWCDSMFFTVVEHACALFEIVQMNLEKVTKAIDDNNLAEDVSYKAICHCIDLHREAIMFVDMSIFFCSLYVTLQKSFFFYPNDYSFADLIEASYSGSLVGVIGFCLLMLSVTGVQAVMHLNEPQEVLRYGSYSIVQIGHLYLNSIPGQRLMDYSLSVFEHAYMSGWDELPIKSKKLLLMLMKRSLRACQLTAGKVYILSMENYSAVIQTSMSYFTVLSSMR